MLSTVSFILINVACLAGVVALVLKNEVNMRFLLLIAAVVFLIGFALSGDLEAWYAGVWAVLIAAVNGVLLVKALASNSTSKFTQREKILYQVFKGLQADEFRELLKITTWNSPQEHTTMTTQDEICDSLFYVLRGKIEVSKDNNIFSLNPNTFIGEVGYFLRSGASATTIIEKGAVYVSWKTKDLRELEATSSGIRAKIYELINKDMAAKVAASQR